MKGTSFSPEGTVEKEASSGEFAVGNSVAEAKKLYLFGSPICFYVWVGGFFVYFFVCFFVLNPKAECMA